MPPPSELLQGTLDLLILKTLSQSPMHGWGVSQRIQQTSRDMLQVKQGSLYPALRRLEDRGWVAADWGVSDNNRKARFFRLTAAGRRRLIREREEWTQFSAAVQFILAAP